MGIEPIYCGSQPHALTIRLKPAYKRNFNKTSTGTGYCRGSKVYHLYWSIDETIKDNLTLEVVSSG